MVTQRQNLPLQSPLTRKHTRPTCVTVYAVSAPKKPSEPAMRDLSPQDTSSSLLNGRNYSKSPPPPLVSSKTPSFNGNGANGSSQPQLMVYKGPPASSSPSTSKADGANSNGTTTSTKVNGSRAGNSTAINSTNRSSTTTTANSTGSLFSGMNAGSGSTFQRSMMVAGFEEDDETTTTFPTDYKYSWAQEDYSETKRSLDTWSFVLTLRARLWLLDQKWSYAGGMTDEKRGIRARALAIWIRERILQLGPTFIKLGQLFSTRSDLFPVEFTAELSKLQDRVPAFDASKAAAIIERELGAPPEVLFAEFDSVPIAAASLGQVHRARLRTTGEQVVVKVQRPGLKKLFDIDLENLRKIAEQLDKGEDTTRDFKGIYQECADILYQEIDYINEGRNADRFRRNFKDTNWVRVPKIHWQRTSTAVLTMEYMPGIKVTDVAGIQNMGIDASSIAQRCTESYLIQILKHGFFHADPHPGNIAVDTNGALIFYDFGMMGEIVPNIRERLLDLFYGISKKDVDSVLANLVNLGIITPSADTLSVRRALAYFVDNIGRQAEQQETVSAIGEDLFAIALDSPFRFPATFTFVLRALATLEGIGKALDPDFAFAAVAAPYAQELLDLQDGRQTAGLILGQLQQQATDLGAAAAAMPARIQKIERTVNQMESGDLKLRVRVLEGERAARRAGVMQVATINTIACVGFLNIATQLALAGQSTAAGGVMVLSSVFGGLVLLGMRRVKRLDKFEDGIKGKGKFPVN